MSAQYRCKVIPRQHVSVSDAAAIKVRLEYARASGLLDSFDGCTHDGCELLVMLSAARLIVAERADFECQIERAERLIDKVIALHSASERPVSS